MGSTRVAGSVSHVYPDVSLEQARAGRTTAVTVRLHYGADTTCGVPRSGHRVAVKAPVVQACFRGGLEFRSRGFKPGSKRLRRRRACLRRTSRARVADRPIAEVAPADLIACLQSVWFSSPSTAQKLLQHLGGTFRHALANDLIEVDPLVKAKLGLGKLKQRVQNFRALSHAEVGAALAKVRSSDAYPSTKLCLAFLTLTATRSGEARLAEWSEIDTQDVDHTSRTHEGGPSTSCTAEPTGSRRAARGPQP